MRDCLLWSLAVERSVHFMQPKATKNTKKKNKINYYAKNLTGNRYCVGKLSKWGVSSGNYLSWSAGCKQSVTKRGRTIKWIQHFPELKCNKVDPVLGRQKRLSWCLDAWLHLPVPSLSHLLMFTDILTLKVFVNAANQAFWFHASHETVFNQPLTTGHTSMFLVSV